MRVVVNCRSILKATQTGIGRYTYNLLDCLGQIDPLTEYKLYCPKRLFDFKRRLPSFPYKNFHPKNDVFNHGVNSSINRFDCYHSPSPDQLRLEGNIVVTVHDLVYKMFPQSHTPETIALTEQYLQQVVLKAKKIICISQSTRQDLHRFFDLPSTRTCVIHNGVDHNIFYKFDEKQRRDSIQVLKERGIDTPYILFVGTLEPRKNLGNLLKALKQLKEQGQFKGKLVVIGMKGWMMEQVLPLIEELGLKSDVILTGYVADHELCMFYNCAKVFVFPSFYEGFGFPILEAFSCGVPVITSNVSSCSEVASDAALLVDPHDPNQIAKAVEKICNDPQLEEKLKEKGMQRAQQFSFLKTARETLAVYKEVAG